MQHLHSAVLSVAIRDEDTYDVCGHVTFCHDEEIFSVTEEFVVKGVKQEGRLSGPLDLLINLMIEQIKGDEIGGLLLRQAGVIYSM